MKHLFSAIHLRFIPYAFLSIGKPYFSEYYCGEHLRYCVENWDNELNTWDNVWRTERVYTLIYLGSCALKTDRRSIENCCVLKLSLRLFLYESMIIWRLPAWKLRSLLNACWDLRIAVYSLLLKTSVEGGNTNFSMENRNHWKILSTALQRILLICDSHWNLSKMIAALKTDMGAVRLRWRNSICCL